MNEVWPPPPTNQPELPPPPDPRSHSGRDALVTSWVATACLLILGMVVLVQRLSHYTIDGLGFVFAFCLVSFLVCWITGIIYSLMSLKTKNGQNGLKVCAAIFAVVVLWLVVAYLK